MLLKQYIELCNDGRAVTTILGPSAFHDEDASGRKAPAKDALRVLTGSAADVGLDMGKLRGVVGEVVGGVVRVGSGSTGPSPEDLDALLGELFVETAGWTRTLESGLLEAKAQAHSAPNSKSVPHGELLSLLAAFLAQAGWVGGGSHAVAVLWREIVLELRWHWENLKPLGRMMTRTPDSRFCLLQQKVDMLQTCILEQIKRNGLRAEVPADRAKATSLSVDSKSTPSSDNNNDSDNEGFHSAVEEEEEGRERGDGPASSTEFTDASTVKICPRGVKEVHSTLHLLSGEPLRVPITQEAGENGGTVCKPFLLHILHFVYIYICKYVCVIIAVSHALVAPPPLLFFLTAPLTEDAVELQTMVEATEATEVSS